MGWKNKDWKSKDLKSGPNAVGIVGLAIAAIIGVVLIGIAADEESQVDLLQTNTNESLTVTTARNATFAHYFDNTTYLALGDIDIHTVSAVRWSNGTPLVVTTDYLVRLESSGFAAGISFQNSSSTIANVEFESNTTVVDYTYYPDDYVKDATGRTIINSILMITFIVGFIVGIVAIIWNKYIKGSIGGL